MIVRNKFLHDASSVFFPKLESHSSMRIFAFEWVRFPISFPLFMSFFLFVYFFFHIKNSSFFLSIYLSVSLIVVRPLLEANTWWVSFPFVCVSSVRLINNPSTHSHSFSFFFFFSQSRTINISETNGSPIFFCVNVYVCVSLSL
jgi:hypothetical protein